MRTGFRGPKSAKPILPKDDPEPPGFRRCQESASSVKFPKVVRKGCNGSFGPSEQKASCTGARGGCTDAKEVVVGLLVLEDLCFEESTTDLCGPS